MGRDSFEKFCAENGLKVRKNKNFRVTTNSKGVTRFENLIENIEVTAVNQVFVSDITYYEMNNRFYYLTFIMDLYNREIVGYSVGENLRTENTVIPAIHMLTRKRGSDYLKKAILHSDGGGQYYSDMTKSVLADLEMRSSMTQESVYENAHAERLNGIIKNNYLYPYNPSSLKELKSKLKKAVWLYNNDKPHSSLKGKTPVEYKYVN